MSRSPASTNLEHRRAVSGRIPQEFIDDLIQRADIVEIIGSRVPLTRAGREYKARCPFHSEKTPSFTVSPHKGFYHCFGCGAHGTALGFLMQFERLEFPVAVEELARSVGVEVPHTDGEQRQSAEPLFAVLEQAGRLYRQALREHPAAIEYLRSRGVDGDTAKEFGIGYAPPGWDTLLSALGGSEGGSKGGSEAANAQLLAAGLVIARDTGGFYDRFRERIMFPIRDSRGRVIAFGGRIVGAGEPKYLNSPETALFHKGRELYGLYECRRAERHPPHLLVVEGYMDVVMLAVHGIRNAVATLGTATTAEHLRRLFGTAAEIVFCFDGDRAGRDAAWRALQVGLPALHDGRQIRFLLLPEGEDPDSLVRREGADAFRQRVAGGIPLSQFLLETLSRDLDLSSPDGKARLAHDAKPLIARLPEGVYRALLIEELAARLGLARQRLEHLLGMAPDPDASSARQIPARQAPATAGRPRTEGRGTLVRQAIGLLLHYPGLAVATPLPEDLASGQRGIELLLELHGLAATRPGMNTAALLERFRGRPELPHLEQLVADDPLVGPEGAAQEFADCLHRMRVAAAQQKVAALLDKAASRALSPSEREELGTLQRRVTELSSRPPTDGLVRH